ncbi:lysozyme inhibitor LprI family protein [Acidovorax sp. Q11]
MHHRLLPPWHRTALALLAAFTLLAAGTQAVHAAEHFCGQRTAHPIDKALGAASERSGGVTVDLIDAQNAAYAAWDKELNRIYAQVLKAAGPGRRDTLRVAQRAWLAFDTAQGQWDSAVFADQGSSAALNIGGAALERRRARVCKLSEDLDSLKDSQ